MIIFNSENDTESRILNQGVLSRDCWMDMHTRMIFWVVQSAVSWMCPCRSQQCLRWFFVTFRFLPPETSLSISYWIPNKQKKSITFLFLLPQSRVLRERAFYISSWAVALKAGGKNSQPSLRFSRRLEYSMH